MLYETSKKKPVSAPARPAAKPAAQAARTPPAAAAKKSQATASAGAPKHMATTTHTKPQTVKGWPSHQKATAKPHTPPVAGHARQQQPTHKVHTAAKPGTAPVKGWPHHHHQQTRHAHATAKPGYTTVSGWPHHHADHKPPLQGVSGHPHRAYRYHGYAPAKTGYATVTGWAHHRKNVPQAVVVPTQPGKVYNQPYYGKPGYRQPQRWYYYKGIRRPYYYSGNAPAPTYIDGTLGQPAAWNTAGTASPSTVPAGCPPQQNYDTVTSTPAQHVCHTCGSTSGCVTLSRFAFNSAQVKPRHISQLRELAQRILNQKINAVVATGHTDSSGSEDYNQQLGDKRAYAVISELKKQLSMLKPNGHKHLFWKTDSKGETQPISKTNPANNRRVEICIRQGRF